MSIHPALALLAVFALPTVLTSTWRPGVERAARGARRAGEPAGAASVRRRHHRAAGQGSARDAASATRLVAERRAAWERWYGPVAAARWGSAGWHTLALGDLRRRATWARWCSCRRCCTATPGDVLLVLAAGSRLSAYIGATVGEIGFLRGIWLDGSRRLAWLEDYAAALVRARRRAGAGAARARASASSTCRSPIPAPSGCVLEDVYLRSQAGHGGGHRRRERRRQDARS